MEQLSINFSGKALRDAGIARAIGNAEKRRSGWRMTAHGYLLEYLGRVGQRSFTGEEVRLFAERRGCPEPPHKRAWGSVILNAAKGQIIRRVGTVQVRNPRAHCANAGLWVAVL